MISKPWEIKTILAELELAIGCPDTGLSKDIPLTPAYGLNLGCIAVKRMVSVTKYGDVMPCPYIHTSLGNFFEEPLKDIVERGLMIKYFGKYINTCLIAEDIKFINDYVVKKIYGKPLPVPYSEVFKDDDLID